MNNTTDIHTDRVAKTMRAIKGKGIAPFANDNWLVNDLLALVNLGKPIKPTSGVKRAIEAAKGINQHTLIAEAEALIAAYTDKNPF